MSAEAPSPASRPPLGRFLKHSGIYAVGNMLNRVGALLLLPIYTNYLTVAEYGALEFFYVISAVVTGLLSVGIAHATLRFYFEYDTEMDRNAVVTTNLTVSFLVTSVGVALVGIWSEEITRAIFGAETSYRMGVKIVLATLVMELSSQVCLAYMRAKERSLLFVGIMFFKLLAQVGANTYLVIREGMGVEGVLLGNMSAVAMGWVILVVFVLRNCGYRFDGAKVMPTLKYSFPFLLSTVTGIVAAYADRFLINSLLTLQALGIYALALKFGEILESLIGEPFNRSYGAYRFSIMKNHDAAKVQADIVRFLTIGLAAAGLGVVYFSHDLLYFMSDKSFWPAAEIVPLLVLAGAVSVLVYPAQTGILYEKKTRHIFHLGLLSALVSVSANYILIQVVGLAGACLAQVVRAVVVLWATNRISQRYFSVRYDLRRIGGVLAIAVVFFALSVPFREMPPMPGIAIKMAMYMGFLVCLYFSGVLDASERNRLRSIVVRCWPSAKA
jgi:O-antigen/teichoic acid export membrane protein